MAELMNSQDMKQKRLSYQNYKEEINGLFPEAPSFKLESYLCAKIVAEESLLGLIVCFNKRDLFGQSPETESEFSKDDINFLKIYRDTIKSVFVKSYGYYEARLEQNAIETIFTVGSVIVGANNTSDLLLRSQEVLNNLFKSRESKILLVEGDLVELLDSKTNRGTIKMEKSKAGIIAEVMQNGVHRFSTSTANDPFFNRLCDLDSQLPSITYPVVDPEKLTIVAAF